MLGRFATVSFGCVILLTSADAFGQYFYPEMGAYPGAYYGRGSTVDGDHMRGMAAMMHASGAERYAAAMVLQQQAAILQAQNQYAMYRASMQQQMAQQQLAQQQLAQQVDPRVEQLEKKLEELSQLNRDLLKKIKEISSSLPAADKPEAGEPDQLAKAQRSRKARAN